MPESRTVRVRKIENGFIVTTEESKRGKYTSRKVYTPTAPKLDVPAKKGEYAGLDTGTGVPAYGTRQAHDLGRSHGAGDAS